MEVDGEGWMNVRPSSMFGGRTPASIRRWMILCICAGIEDGEHGCRWAGEGLRRFVEFRYVVPELQILRSLLVHACFEGGNAILQCCECVGKGLREIFCWMPFQTARATGLQRGCRTGVRCERGVGCG